MDYKEGDKMIADMKKGAERLERAVDKSILEDMRCLVQLRNDVQQDMDNWLQEGGNGGN